MNRSFLFILALLLVSGCGTDSGSNGVASSSDANEKGIETSIITNLGSTYTIDDVKATGWKFSRDLPTDSLEGVSAASFGFFQQKNLEVWIYDSHEDAKRLGSDIAEEIVVETRGVSGGAAGPYMKQITHYRAYGVVGNLVILCETDVAVCEDLASALP